MEELRVANPSDIQHGGPYRELRRAYYDRFPGFWGTLPGERIEEYAIYGALEMPEVHAEALRTASARLYQLLTKLTTMLQQTGDEAMLAIGVPPPALSYVRTAIPEMPPVMCGRFEFVMTAQGPRLLEFNAETPTFVVELFSINSQVCADFGLIDPNEGCQEQLKLAIRASIDAGLSWIGAGEDASVLFSAYTDQPEEHGTTEFYRHLLESDGKLPYRTSFHGLDELRVTPDCLLTADGERVDVLYKLYPTEFLIEDRAPDGSAVGLALMDLVRERKLAVINPPSAFVLQNKALVAVLWAMHLLESDLFTAEEHGWIEQYVLPTYLDAYDEQGQAFFAGQYVVKPVYGREGASIAIRDGNELVEQSEDKFYDGQVMVYQQYAALPTVTIQTEDGLAEANLVHNCFVVGGLPSAVGVRACRKLIFDDTSYFVPICSPPGSHQI